MDDMEEEEEDKEGKGRLVLLMFSRKGVFEWSQGSEKGWRVRGENCGLRLIFCCQPSPFFSNIKIVDRCFS